MNEQAPQYHPEVENAIETSGPDIGRVKDTELARDVAKVEDQYRTNGKELVEEGYFTAAEVESQNANKADRLVKVELARRAVDQAADRFLNNIAAAGSRHDRLTFDDPVEETNKLLATAGKVADDYDVLQAKVADEESHETADL